MLSFKEFLQEAVLNIGNRSGTPKYNQVIILAGGAGSGKSLVVQKILNIPNAKIINSDDLRASIVKAKPKGLDAEFQKRYGKSLSQYSSKNPDDVSNLYNLVKERSLDDKTTLWQLKANENSDNKPNLIFDGTFKRVDKLKEVSDLVQKYGYKREDIHIVWVLNDINIALIQNAKRSRSVRTDILTSTHIGASNTFNELLRNFEKYTPYMDGDIYVVPNKAKVDNVFTVSKNGDLILNAYKAIPIKMKGEPIRSFEDIMESEYEKTINGIKTKDKIRNILNGYIPTDAKRF